MDTKKLRELAEALDVLSGAIVQLAYGSEEVGSLGPRVNVLGLSSKDPKIAEKLKAVMESALSAARKQLQEEIRSEANKGHLMPRTPEKDPYSPLTRGWTFEESIGPIRPKL